MDNAVGEELRTALALYQFYFETYTKGVALFLAITGVLVKVALDSVQYRAMFAIAGVLTTLAIGIVLVYGFLWERVTAKEFVRLAGATGTKAISTRPFLAMAITVAVFWTLLLIGWIYILTALT